MSHIFSIKICITYVRKSFLGCGCNSEGSRDQFCDVDSGHCFCNEHVDGDKCDKCDHSYFNFPNCEGRTFFPSIRICWNRYSTFILFFHPACHCSPHGSVHDEHDHANCDENGKCTCIESYMGDKCDTCIPGHYNVNNNCHRKL